MMINLSFRALVVLVFVPTQMIAQIADHSPHIAVRAAIDFGSGAIKIQAALVDTAKRCIIGEPLIAKHVSLHLTEDVEAHGGLISEEMQEKSLTLLKQLMQETSLAASRVHTAPLQWAGIATAVFRKAHNGADVLQKFKKELAVEFKILSHEEEGILGFMTAKALFAEIPGENIIAYDNGNGSFQMTALDNDSVKVYHGPLGHGTVRILLSKEVRKGPVLQSHQSGNPVLPDEAESLMQKIKDQIPLSPDWFNIMVNQGATVATFGDGLSLFAVMAQSQATHEGITTPINQAVITLSSLKRLRDRYLGKPDDVFDTDGVYRNTLTGALYLLTVMEHLNISTIHYRKSIGNTSGMLISPHYWKSLTEGYLSVPTSELIPGTHDAIIEK